MFISELKSVFLTSVRSNEARDEIFLKGEPTKMVKETVLMSDTYYINIPAAEIDRLCIVLWVR